MKYLFFALVAVTLSACARPYPYDPYYTVDEYPYGPVTYTYQGSAYTGQPITHVRQVAPAQTVKPLAVAPVTTMVQPAPIVTAPAQYVAPQQVPAQAQYVAPQVIVPTKAYRPVYTYK
jgi:hypothetical protein